MSFARVGLMEGMGVRDAPLSKLHGDPADFLDRPADQERCFGRDRGRAFLSDGAVLARRRMTAMMTKASMTSETW
jgi:hypothetical protein